MPKEGLKIATVYDFKKIKDVSRDEIVAKMRSGEIEPPTDKVGRAKFTEFVGMSNEDREKFLNPEAPAPDPKPEETPGDKPPENPQGEEPKGVEPWYKDLGYETEDKAKEAHRSLLNQAAELQGRIDRINATEGKRGQELKRLKEDLERTTGELLELKKASKPKVEKPVRPKRPNQKDYPDGIMDQGYADAMSKYDEDLSKYEESQEAYLANMLSSTIEERVTPPPSLVQEPPSDAWNKLFDKDIPEFQKRFKLETTVPVRRISESYNVINGNGSEADKAAARAFIASLPEADAKAYDKVRKAVELAYQFDSGVPTSQYRTIEGALFDNGLIGDGKEYNYTVPVRLSADEERLAREQALLKKQQDESSIPASSMAGADGKVSDANTVEEKKNRLRLLNAEYNRALNAGPEARTQFENSQKYQDFLVLARELGLKTRVLK